MITKSAIDDFTLFLRHACQFNADSSNFSYWKIGGPVSLLVEPNSVEELALSIKLLHIHNGVPSLVVGDGSNLLYDSRGFNGILIKVGNSISDIRIEGTRVTCEAGLWVPELTYRLSGFGLSGIEHVCGIPGRLGGLIYMNGGTNRRSILDNVVSVELINKNGEIEVEYIENLTFGYRSSPFQNEKRVIARVTLDLVQSTRKKVRTEIRRILASRRERFPRNYPNCGSVFLSDPKMYSTVGAPGFAIEQAGLKGVCKGGAQISTQHANFIVNKGKATSEDVLYLINLIRITVFKQTGFFMDCEVRYVAPCGNIMPAHIESDKRWNNLNV